MFISIPLLAIVKLVCDHIEPLKPWGFLLGDTMPPLIRIKSIFKKPVQGFLSVIATVLKMCELCKF